MCGNVIKEYILIFCDLQNYYIILQLQLVILYVQNSSSLECQTGLVRRFLRIQLEYEIDFHFPHKRRINKYKTF